MASFTDVDIDPVRIDQLLERKRKRWRKSRKKKLSNLDEGEERLSSSTEVDSTNNEDIDIQSELAEHLEHSSTHVYQWVVIMEHQRGFTLFNTSHYSAASLFPNDPPPLQVHDSIRDQPWAISTFEDYTLPSPLWLWLSRHWMVDMRGDGEVDSNGWQYGRAFNSTTWRPHVKSFNRGGWVRQRRWVRLMMKPGIIVDPVKNLGMTNQAALNPLEIWKGDGNDWIRCRRVLKARATDGLRLELWSFWFTKENLKPVLRSAVESQLEEILKTFVYPETRTQFLLLLRDTKMMNTTSITMFTSDFWSYREMLSTCNL